MQFAIKTLRADVPTWKEAVTRRESKALFDLCQGQGYHKYLIKVYDFMLKDSSLHFVCEYMPDGSLNDLLELLSCERQQLDADNIRSILFQACKGLQHIHSKGYIHRDMKPENLLLRKLPDGNYICKITDFSLARSCTLVDAETKMTTYVATRWYRAPEMILLYPTYSIQVDCFALGCIFCEMYRGSPLFPGESELEQLRLILSLMGNLKDSWDEGHELAKKLGVDVDDSQGRHQSSVLERLEAKIPRACPLALDLAMNLLHLNPEKRPTADEALQYEYLAPMLQITIQARYLDSDCLCESPLGAITYDSKVSPGAPKSEIVETVGTQQDRPCGNLRIPRIENRFLHHIGTTQERETVVVTQEPLSSYAIEQDSITVDSPTNESISFNEFTPPGRHVEGRTPFVTVSPRAKLSFSESRVEDALPVNLQERGFTSSTNDPVSVTAQDESTGYNPKLPVLDLSRSGRKRTDDTINGSSHPIRQNPYLDTRRKQR